MFYNVYYIKHFVLHVRWFRNSTFKNQKKQLKFNDKKIAKKI